MQSLSVCLTTRQTDVLSRHNETFSFPQDEDVSIGTERQMPTLHNSADDSSRSYEVLGYSIQVNG